MDLESITRWESPPRPRAVGIRDLRKDGSFIGDVHPGDYFGELSLIDGLPRSADVIASDEGLTTFAIPKWTLAPTSTIARQVKLALSLVSGPSRCEPRSDEGAHTSP